MRVLGVDTATATASVAIVESGNLLAEAISSEQGLRDSEQARFGGGYSQTLIPLIDRVLARANLSFRHLAAIAVSIGPGSFTGLRIGLSTVKGLAFAGDISVVGVSTLRALAARVHDWQGLICPILDARKNEVYAALFYRQSGNLQRIGGDAVELPEKTIEKVQARREGRPCLFIGDAVSVYGATIARALGQDGVLNSGKNYPSVAAAVALLGAEKIAAAGADAVESLAPHYLRSSAAELLKR
jgi:tRNA threonylcarbamoyladenosine biosynthesis protein TsaB